MAGARRSPVGLLGSALLHAGIIGALVLAGTVSTLFDMKREFGFSHPDWMIEVEAIAVI